LQNVNPYLQFNNAKIKYRTEPYLVNDGDNVAWTGEEWDRLAGTFEIDLSDYATKDEIYPKEDLDYILNNKMDMLAQVSLSDEYGVFVNSYPGASTVADVIVESLYEDGPSKIHKLTEKANTADLATISTSGDIYDISNAGAVQTSVGTDDTGEKYIVFNCGSSTTVI
jgi:hypothetical protein